MEDFAIRLLNACKHYKLYADPKDRLKEVFHPRGKQYHKKHNALKNITLDIKKGEILGVVGQNGSGKSTLLKLMANVLTPNSGSSTANGKISAILELGGGLNREFTGLQNIHFMAALQGYNDQQIASQIPSIIAFADIGDYINHPLKTYSNGMQARLSFAIAVNVNPDILILDEVLAVGDELFRRKCFAKMEEFFNSGKTIIYVSHDANSVIELCSRAILLDAGQILLDADPKTVVNYYQKYLYAKPSRKPIIREEILGLQSTLTDNNATKPGTDGLSTIVDLPATEHYIPELKPTAPLENKYYNVSITEVCLKSVEHEKKCNVLLQDRKYTICATIEFGVEATDVGFSFSIKNEKGMDISTFRTLSGAYVNARTGDNFDVTWCFTNKLMPGIYYLNVGVRSYPANQESFILNRIIDADAFKVEKSARTNIGGFVSLDQTMEVNKREFSQSKSCNKQ